MFCSYSYSVHFVLNHFFWILDNQTCVGFLIPDVLPFVDIVAAAPPFDTDLTWDYIIFVTFFSGVCIPELGAGVFRPSFAGLLALPPFVVETVCPKTFFVND